MKFERGDLVLITDTEHRGSVTTVQEPCYVCFMAMLAAIMAGVHYYRLNGFPNMCFHEGVLKKIDGDRPKAETKTEETRDAPVEA